MTAKKQGGKQADKQGGKQADKQGGKQGSKQDKSIEKQVEKLKKEALRYGKRVAKDVTLWYLYPARYKYLCWKQPVVPGRVVFFEGKDRGMRESFVYLNERLQADPTKSVVLVTTEQAYVRYLTYVRNCYNTLPDLAKAEVIFVDDACELVSCLPLRPETRAIQLWHACGAFKKWGMSCAEKKFGGSRAEIERHPFYKNLSLVTVSSPEVAWAYAEAMDLEDTPEVIQALGVSRTDKFFDPKFLANARSRVEKAFPAAAGKKIILYAPTFRGRVKTAKGPDRLNIKAMRKALGKEYVLIIKHHPFVKHPEPVPKGCHDFAHLVHGDLETDELLAAADVCITDYSSIVFEYSLFGRPLIFFAYDIADFDDWRGFYYPYEEFTPGPVVKTTKEIIAYLQQIDAEGFDSSAVDAFRNKFMSACDGHATDRILAAAFPESHAGDQAV